MARRRHRRKKSPGRSKRKSSRKSWWLSKYLLYPLLLLTVVATGYIFYVDNHVRANFEGKRWALPAEVFARPLELYIGKSLSRNALLYELDRLGYKLEDNPEREGTYNISNESIAIVTREFQFSDETQASKHITLKLENDIILSLVDSKTTESIDQSIRLDPVLIGKIFPSHNEDRKLIKLPKPDAPARKIRAYKLLTDILKAVEDRNFNSHFGISFRGIARAMWNNFRSGKTRQGGSTLTQQLAKNYFLTPEKTLKRKFNEMIMAVLLEVHYEKDEIMEAYLNEVFLGQDGRRAIHGFGLAAKFYFNRDIEDLELQQMALLVGMVKGASALNPRRNPGRALRRRNVVLDVLVEQKVIDRETMLNAKEKPLGVETANKHILQSYPAFVDLIRQQLRRDYKDEDLVTGGLKIHTTLDPIVQYYAEAAMKKWIVKLEDEKKLEKGKLQGAMIITSYSDGDVLAVVGDRNPKYPGFNRVLKAKRHIGSLIKPAVYLAALLSDKTESRSQQPFTPSTLLDDSEFTFTFKNGTEWSPKNYDKQNHGDIPLYLSLAHSYNIPTARLGLEVGLDEVIDTIHKLGIKKKITANPSLLLGAVRMTPLEVAKMYQTIANGGFNTQMRTIRTIMNSKGEKLSSNPTVIERVVPPGPIYQINYILQKVIAEGTGRGMARYLPKEFHVAGKTGTTDNSRDSWFSGFTGNYLGVVWLGIDQAKDGKNVSTRLTGSSGALHVWGETMKNLNPVALNLRPQEDWDIEFRWVNPANGLVTTEKCSGAVQLPFQKSKIPSEDSSCRGGIFRIFK